MKLVASLCVLTLLGGCATRTQCPAIPVYSSLEKHVLADELPKDGPESQIQIEDYYKLRTACGVI